MTWMLKRVQMTNYYAFRISKRCRVRLAFSGVSHLVILNLFQDLVIYPTNYVCHLVISISVADSRQCIFSVIFLEKLDAETSSA